jgi:hypothetical protein
VIPGLGRCDPRLREQVRAEQVSKGPGIHGIVLHPRRGGRLGGERVGHVSRDAGVGEQIGEPTPAEGGLERDLERLVVQLPEDAEHLVGAGRDAPVEDRLTSLIQRHDVCDLAMQVHTDVDHDWAPFPVACPSGPYVCSKHGSGRPAPSWHQTFGGTGDRGGGQTPPPGSRRNWLTGTLHLPVSFLMIPEGSSSS